jgi:hypothetical protein
VIQLTSVRLQQQSRCRIVSTVLRLPDSDEISKSHWCEQSPHFAGDGFLVLHVILELQQFIVRIELPR